MQCHLTVIVSRNWKHFVQLTSHSKVWKNGRGSLYWKSEYSSCSHSSLSLYTQIQMNAIYCYVMSLMCTQENQLLLSSCRLYGAVWNSPAGLFILFCSPVYSWPCSAVRGGWPYTGHRPHHLTPSPLCQVPSARRWTLSALHLRPSGVLGRSPSNLEFTAGWSVGSGTEFWLLQTTIEDGTFSDHQCIQCFRGVITVDITTLQTTLL